MATSSTTTNIDTLYSDLMSLCFPDEPFYYKNTRLHGITYRIFNDRLCSYGRFQTRAAALNCCGTMFNITNPKKIELVSLSPERIFDYEEGFGQKQFHERGQLGEKMEKMDGTLMSTFLDNKALRLKSKQSLTSNQVLAAMRLLADDFKSEIERLVRLNYTVNMEYTSPSNHVFVRYQHSQLTVLSIRSHVDGQTLFASRLKRFLLENHFPTIVNHLVPFESISSNITHRQLIEDIYAESHGEGYVIEIIQPDRPSYLVKIKTKKYSVVHGDIGSVNSLRSLFEAIIIFEHTDDLKSLFQNDVHTLKNIEEMEENVRPTYNQMLQLVEEFYRTKKHLSRKDFIQSIITDDSMKIYFPLLIGLYAGKENDYKGFAMKHAKDLFGIPKFSLEDYQGTAINQNMLE